MPETSLSPIRQARRRKILGVAEQLFVTQGYGGVTMEGVAKAAAVSKVTLYGYFSDKDALFDGVAGVIATDMRDAFEAALAQGGTVADRVLAALVAKHRIVQERVRKSRFAPELFATKNRSSAMRFQTLEADFIARLTQVLTAAGVPDDKASSLATVLFAASQGIANAAGSGLVMETQIRMLRALIEVPTETDQPPK